MADPGKALASNPARLPFSFARYVKCKPVVLAAPVIAFVGMMIFVLVKGIPIWVGIGLAVIFAIVAIQSMVASAKRQLQEGNICAALVVSATPFTVAVLTDLCNDRSGPKLAIKIIKKPLQNMAGGPPKIDDKLAAASWYFGDTGTGAWQDFSPMIVNCACDDQAQIKRAIESINPRDWQILSQGMKSLKPTDFGLHHLQI